ncbi:MAG: twin-arginine translocase TatA/TatE family subunit [Firmicutes bacterium]|nr:twin-arginine translocase TatA/TatE family subunit [Bacillota bacterium]
MFNGLFQPTHLILILVVVLIVFGPGKLPEAGKAMGKALRDMRDAFSSEDDEKKEKEQVIVESSDQATKGIDTTKTAASASETTQTTSVNH